MALPWAREEEADEQKPVIPVTISLFQNDNHLQLLIIFVISALLKQQVIVAKYLWPLIQDYKTRQLQDLNWMISLLRETKPFVSLFWIISFGLFQNTSKD